MLFLKVISAYHWINVLIFYFYIEIYVTVNLEPHRLFPSQHVPCSVFGLGIVRNCFINKVFVSFLLGKQGMAIKVNQNCRL